LAGKKFGELPAKLQLVKLTLAKLSPTSIAISDSKRNWWIKLLQIHTKFPSTQ